MIYLLNEEDGQTAVCETAIRAAIYEARGYHRITQEYHRAIWREYDLECMRRKRLAAYYATYGGKIYGTR